MDEQSRSLRRRVLAALCAATLLNTPYGTIYAFSVFLRPMEQALEVSRTQMSVVFATATVMLTVGMNLSPWLGRRFDIAWVLAVSGALGALGLGLVSIAQGFGLLFVGYGLMFGLGGGLSFTAVQQAVNGVTTRSSGLANGYVVSLYPVGAMIGAPLFSRTLIGIGLEATLLMMGAVLLVCGLVAALLCRLNRIRFFRQPDARPALGETVEHVRPAEQGPDLRLVFSRMFALLFLAASAGLMVLSQASGILLAHGGSTALAVGATTAITGAIACARLAGGWWVDHWPMPRVAMGAHLWSLGGAVLITVWPNPWVMALALAMMGMGYGFISGCSAGAIPQYWTRDAFAGVAGRLYIAWGTASLCLPVLAGWLFDLSGHYGLAVIIAGAGNALGVWVAWRTPNPPALRPRS